jgi:hypothetical protein
LTLRHVDPEAPLGPLYRVWAGLASSRRAGGAGRTIPILALVPTG